MKLRKALSLSALALATILSGPITKAADNPSIFIRYQYSVEEMVKKLESAAGKPLDPASTEARWLDEMGWRKWVNDSKPFQLTKEMKDQLLQQEKFLSSSFSYQVGDAIWVPAENGEKPYGFSQANVNPRGQIKQIISGEKGTYFVVEVGVDNGAEGGITTKPGTYYDGKKGPVLHYEDSFKIETKTYIYSLNEIERFNAPFRSEIAGSDTGAQVNYKSDQKWIDKLNSFKEVVASKKLEVDFTKSPKEIYNAQKKIILELFHEFKMDRNAPGGGPLLGDMANGGGSCFTQACVLSHATHAVGEPWGIKAINISGSTINPQGGHGFVRLVIRGPEEAHVFDMVENDSGKVTYKGLTIKSSSINFISDPGWADYGKTPDQFAMTPIEDAINPRPVDANRALYDILQGKSFEEVVEKYGKKGPFVTNQELNNDLFAKAKGQDFLSPKAQLSDAPAIESAIGKSELDKMVQEAKSFKGEPRAIKTKILLDLVEPRIAQLKVPGASADGIRILLTEYVFRAIR